MSNEQGSLPALPRRVGPVEIRLDLGEEISGLQTSCCLRGQGIVWAVPPWEMTATLPCHFLQDEKEETQARGLSQGGFGTGPDSS
jgi:hypothetical protein